MYFLKHYHSLYYVFILRTLCERSKSGWCASFIIILQQRKIKSKYKIKKKNFGKGFANYF